jgi:hypothetical protein
MRRNYHGQTRIVIHFPAAGGETRALQEGTLRFNDAQLQALGDFQSWKEGEDGTVSLLDYAAYTATPDQLFGYAALYFRELREVDGHYYFVDSFDQKLYDEWRTRKPGREIQATMNELPMSKLLGNADVDSGAAMNCARLLGAAWNEVYGRKGLVAEVHGETLEDLAVTLVNGHE